MIKLNYSQDRLAEAKEVRARWYNGEKTRTPFILTGPPKDAGYRHNYKEMCEDSKIALDAMLSSIQYQLDTFPDCDYLPVMRLGYMGQGLLAALYGAEQYVVEKDPPFTKGRIFKDIYETERLSNEFDFDTNVWGRKLKEHADRFVDATKGQIPIGPPDFQSPYGIASKLMPNEELMMALYDEPELTRQFLDKVTDGIIKLLETIEKWVGVGNFVHNVDNPIPGKCGIIIWDDYISVLNPELHKEFCGPCNRKLYDRFGYGHLHTCGPYFPAYIDACLMCRPKSMDISIMRGETKTKSDLLEFLSIAQKNNIRLLGFLTISDDSVFNNNWIQADNTLIEDFVRGGWMPQFRGDYEDGMAFAKIIQNIDKRI